MVKKDEDGYVSLLMPNNHVIRRQDAPKVYDIIPAFYIIKPEQVLNNSTYWFGKVKGVEISRFHAVDIDTEFDFKIAENYFYHD